MSELVKRLRGPTWVMSCYSKSEHLYAAMREAMREAADALEAQAKRIAELEDQISTQKAAARVMTSRKVAELEASLAGAIEAQQQAEADIARLWVFRTAFEHIEAHISCSLDGTAWMPLNEWQGHAAIDAALSHSANTVGVPTPVMDAAPACERKAFEQWYATNAFDYEANPIGSRECGLMWKAWQAAQSADIRNAGESDS